MKLSVVCTVISLLFFGGLSRAEKEVSYDLAEACLAEYRQLEIMGEEVIGAESFQLPPGCNAMFGIEDRVPGYIKRYLRDTQESRSAVVEDDEDSENQTGFISRWVDWLGQFGADFSKAAEDWVRLDY